MMLQAVTDMFERAFKKGTHIKEQDFLVLSKNMETICFQGPDGTRRTVGSFPGSAKAVQVSRASEREIIVVPTATVSTCGDCPFQNQTW